MEDETISPNKPFAPLNAYMEDDATKALDYKEYKKRKDPDAISFNNYRNRKDSGAFDNTFSHNAEYEIEGNFKKSRFLTAWDDPRKDDIDEKLAHRQGWGTKAGTGLLRLGTKVASEIAKMPGVLGGLGAATYGQIVDVATGKDKTDFITTAFDNPWIQAVTDLEDHIKDEVLPVYVKKAVKDGNLWDNITSIDFWATDGADGLGYIISMLAPGAAINKLGIGAKLLKLGKLEQMAVSSEKAAEKLNKLGVTAKNIDLHSSTLANTLFEAGAEAKGAMDGYVRTLEGRRLLAPNDPGYLSDEEYQKALLKKGEVGQKVFLSNVGILIGPNAIMTKMIWGNKLNASKLAYKDGVFERVKQLTTKQAITKAGNRFASGTLREGFWEEGMQSTAENFFTENPNKGYGDFIGDLGNAYLNTVSTTEGQKAIFLGAVFGGTMQSVFEGKADKKNTNHQNSLIEKANDMLAKFDAFFETDNKVNENGEEEFADDVLVKRAKAVIEKAGAINELEILSNIYDEAIASGNTKTVKDIKHLMVTNLIKPFILNDNMGLDALQKHLEAASSLIALTKKENIDKDTYIKEIMEKAKFLKDSYNTFKNFNDIFIELTNKKASPAMKESFLDNMINNYINNQSNLKYYTDQLTEVEKNLNDALEGYNSSILDVTNNPKKLVDLGRNDKRIPQLAAERLQLLKEVEIGKDINSNIWNEKEVNKSFNKYVEQDIAATKAQEKIDFVNDISTKINTATNEEELDAIEIPKDEDYSPILNQLREEARQEIIKDKEVEQKAANAENTDNIDEEALRQAEVKEQLNFVKNSYNIGEALPTQNLDVPEGFENSTLEEISDSHITIKNEKGETHDIPLKDFYIANYDVDDQYSSQDTDNIEEDNENIIPHTIAIKNDARIAITDNQPNAKVLFNDLIEAYKIEINPRDKRGYYGISINNANAIIKGTSNYSKAFKQFSEEGVTSENIDFLMDNLSLNINLTDTIGAPLENRPAKNKSQEVYNDTTAKLKSVVFNELLKGTPLSDIKIEIKGQYSGNIQLEVDDMGRPAENNIADLYYFEDISDVVKNKDKFYIVNDKGQLENNKGDIYATQRPLRAKGEIYLMVPMANGRDFPLKLNISKVSTEQADFLHAIYKLRFDDFENGKLKEVSEEERGVTGRNRQLPSELVERFKTEFPNVWELFKSEDIDEESIKFKDILDFFLFDKTSNIKSRVRFNKGGLQVGNITFDKETFDEQKEEFINQLTSSKRQHIKFKKKANDSNDLNLNNPAYLRYLIQNNILNTNAIKEEPIFQGRTTMYVGTGTVKVGEKLSDFNDTTVKYRDNLFGTNKGLEKVLPSLFTLGLTLDETGNFYIDKKGNKYKRVSDLVPYTGDTSGNEAANKRGNVIDLLIRDFFSAKQELTTLERFINAGQTFIGEQNKKTKGEELVMDDTFLESIYEIFNHYAKVFNELNYTIYSDIPSVAFKLNEESYAGTVDLLIYDNKNKVFKIIDLKTSSADREESYNKSNKYGYKGKDVIQQNAYREGFNQTAKVNINSLEILPITTKSVAGQQGNYVGQKAKRTSVDFLKVDMSKDIYELKNINKDPAQSFDMGSYIEQEDMPFFDAEDETGDFNDYWGHVTGEIIPEAPKTPTVVNEPIPTKIVDSTVLGGLQIGNKEYDTFTINGKQYALTHAIIEGGKVTGGLIVFGEKGIVTDPAIINKIITERNETVASPTLSAFVSQPIKIGPQGIKDSIARVQPSVQPKAVPNIAKVIEKKVDFNTYTKEQATAIYKDLFVKGIINASNSKTINQLVKGKSPQQILEIVTDYLIKQGANKEEIHNICKK